MSFASCCALEFCWTDASAMEIALGAVVREVAVEKLSGHHCLVHREDMLGLLYKRSLKDVMVCHPVLQRTWSIDVIEVAHYKPNFFFQYPTTG